MNSFNASRRKFVAAAAGISTIAARTGATGGNAFALSLGSLGALAAHNSARADDGAGYKALVCLYMHGGNDSHNWVVPVDADGYAEYAAARTSIALARSGLQPLGLKTSQGSGREFGMPSALAPLRSLYDAGEAAIVANVGTLVRPTTKAQFVAGAGLPAKLFSHNDQMSTWQSLSPEGARSGWGGRMGDLFASGNAHPVFTAISASGNAVFLAGNSTTPYEVSVDGAVKVKSLDYKAPMASMTAGASLRRLLTDPGSGRIQAEYSRIVQRSMDTYSSMASALASTPAIAIPRTAISAGSGPASTLDQDGLAQQLQIVSRIIMAQSALGMRRQVFMVSIGGFDTHANQLRYHPALMQRVAGAIEYFTRAMNTAGLSDNVTLFTASDFGRALRSNGSGCDHGWGSHHFVVGGAVKGGNIYGRMPQTAFGTEDEVGSGRLLPSISVTQYAATLGRWMGLSNSDLATVLPGLENFSAGPAFI